MEQQDLNSRLISILTSEMETEILINEDTTGFWKKTNAAIFEESLPSFREALQNLVETMGTDKDMYNYFSSMVARVLSDPSARPALELFVTGFDTTISDPVLAGGFNYKAKDISPVGQLMLFISVHRNLITLAMYAKERADATQKKKKNDK